MVLPFYPNALADALSNQKRDRLPNSGERFDCPQRKSCTTNNVYCHLGSGHRTAELCVQVNYSVHRCDLKHACKNICNFTLECH